MTLYGTRQADTQSEAFRANGLDPSATAQDDWDRVLHAALHHV
jgi:hypothetical protein